MWQYNYTDELYHYGVKGMRWGHRKAYKYQNKARIAKASAKEWDEMAGYAEQKGKHKLAAKYRNAAVKDRDDAKRYQELARATKTIDKEKARVGKEKAKKLLLTIGVTAAAVGAVAVGQKAVERYSDMKIGKVTLEKGVEFVQGYRR